MDLYETLGVARDATPAQIKKAFRKRVKETHPDLGGNDEDFRAVNLAGEVLQDPARRKRYDETGTIDDPKLEAAEREQRVKAIVTQLVDEALGRDPLYSPLDFIFGRITQTETNLRGQIEAANRRLKLLRRHAKRWRKKVKAEKRRGLRLGKEPPPKAEPDLVADLIAARVKAAEADRDASVKALELQPAVRAFFGDYEWDPLADVEDAAELDRLARAGIRQALSAPLGGRP